MKILKIILLNTFNCILLSFLLTFPYKCQAKHIYSEHEYQSSWCNKHGGKIEHVLNDKTRIDCLLNDVAVEVDFAPKWAECIGQAIYYAKMTNKIPACLLILEKETDTKYLNRLYYSVHKPFRIFIISPSDITSF